MTPATLSTLDVLYDSPTLLAELRKLIVTYSVIGKSIHDAKLVAAMIAGGVRHILTFNGRDFARFAAQIDVLDPSFVSQSQPRPRP